MVSASEDHVSAERGGGQEGGKRNSGHVSAGAADEGPGHCLANPLQRLQEESARMMDHEWKRRWWWLLGVVGSYSQLLGVSGGWWGLLGVVGSYSQLLSVSGG